MLAALLVKPLFQAGYLDRWSSIESTFIADARFLNENWPHPGWQPLWYCGTRFDYIYPPALRYGTALLANIWAPVRAYHVYTAFFYCFGIAGVYFFVRAAQGSRGAAWLAAAATALLSPSFLFLADQRHDAWLLVPQRLGVLTRYGEGPHITALAFIPVALAFAWRAVRDGRFMDIALAALAAAAVVSNNFYGATALAMLYPLVVWSIWVTRRNVGIWRPATAIPALAYGLCAFWLVPSYLRVTTENLRYVSKPGAAWSLWLAVAVVLAFVWLTYRLPPKRRDAYTIFVAGSLVFFALNVLGNHFFDFRVAGEPVRLVPELDLVAILFAAECLRRMWVHGRNVRIAAVLFAAAAFWTSHQYIGGAWRIFPKDPDYRTRIEYRIQDWMARNMPGARALATGSVRFWYDVWHDLPQVGGGSDQGILNGNVVTAMWHVRMAESAELPVEWLLALGADAVVVHDRNSREFYHDIVHPEKFAAVLPVVYDNQAGDVIYKLPRRYPDLARVVETARIRAVPPIAATASVAELRAYTSVVEHGPGAPAQASWDGAATMSVRARTTPGESVLVQVSYDPAWRAWSAGRPLAIEKDALGFMLIDVPPGEHQIRLEFVTPLENVAGRAVSVLSLAAIVLLAAAPAFRRRVAPRH